MIEKFINKLSERTIKIGFILLASIILIICGYNFINSVYFNALGNDQCVWIDVPGRRVVISQIVKNGVTDRAGIMNGDTLLTINGRRFKSGIDAMNILNKVKYGEYARYQIKRGDKIFETDVRVIKAININTIAQFILGLGFLIVGFVVIMSKPKGSVQWRFGLYALLSMFFFGLFELRFDATTPMWMAKFFGICYILSRILAPPMFIIFFLHFPVKLKWADNKIFISSVHIWNLFLVAVFLFTQTKMLIGFVNFIVWHHVTFYLFGLLIFIYSYSKKVEKEKKSQLRPILIGIVIGFLAFIYTFIISGDRYAIFLNPAILMPTMFIVVVPIFFGYSIFRYKLMDIDLIIRRSLIYGIVTTTFAVIYIVFVLGLGTVVNEILETNDNQTISILAFIVIAFAFDPLKRRVQNWVDRFYYQDRYNYQKALLEFSKELPTKIDLTQILDSTVNRISNTMHIEKVAVSIITKDDCKCISKNINSCLCVFSSGNDGLYNYLKKIKSPQSFALLSEEFEQVQLNREDKEKLIKSGVILAVPMFFKENLVGIILVGDKLSGKFYSQEDIDLLLTVANQAAIAVENARLYESEIEKQKIQEELSLAKKIQQGLLPKNMPDIEGVSISAISAPAEMVGGDYYDLIQISKDKFFVVVADVAGKGISAALYMSKIQGMIQLAARIYKSPKDILTEVNRRIYEGMERKSFITMILALFDFESKEVTICRAGHNKPIFKTNGNLRFLDSEGMGLGLEAGKTFDENLKESIINLNGSGFFMFYSDGLTEMMNSKFHEFGEERLMNFLKENFHLNAEDIKVKLLNEIDAFRENAEQNDDLTFVIVKLENVNASQV